MKIFLISNMYPSADSPGFGIFVKNVAAGLDLNGVETVKMAVLEGRARSKWDKIRRYLKLYRSVVKGFFTRYDAIYIHFPNQVIPILRLLFAFRKRDIIINFHGEDLLYSDHPFHSRLGRATEAFCRKYATGIVVPSQYYADIVSRRGIVGKERIVVSPSGGIGKDLFVPKDRKTAGADIDRPLHLGYVGRLEDGKGILEFLAVLKRARERHIPYRATIVGYGQLMDATRSYIRENGLMDVVNVIPGVPQSELSGHYQSFDLLFFLSSRPEESLGLTGIESMACGTPVVGSSIGGIASYLEDRKNGYMIHDICDADSIADIIEEYRRSSGSDRIVMYEHAVATGRRYFSDAVCKRLAADFKNLLHEE